MKICPKCGEENSERARFCQACGAPLDEEQRSVQEVRKIVSVVFSDVTGSTGLGERLDPESMRRIMSRYFESMQQVLERHGGTVEKFIGDAVMAVFGIPHVHEDDALRAVRAADEMRKALAVLNDDLESRWGVRLQNRTGVNTGEVVTGNPGAGQTLVTGDAVNVAARLEQSAQPGEILIGESTYRLVRDAVMVEHLDPLSLKGKGEPVAAWRLVEVKAGAPGFNRRLDSPLVGRERECALLRQAFDRSVSDQSCQLFTVLGPAGAGKSRLVDEFVLGVETEATVLRGRCLPYGDGITFWPIKEIVQQAAHFTDEDTPAEARAKIAELLAHEHDPETISDRISAAIGLSEQVSTQEEIFWAARKLLETTGRDHPLVVIFDDIHWADQTFLDLIEHITDWSRDAPIHLVCLARPELLDLRPSWGGGMLNATTILLEPLKFDDCERLIDNLLGSSGLSPIVRTRITESAEGNPLFVEELLRMLIDDGLLGQVNSHWEATQDLAEVPVPATIQALLSARLDRLNGEERGVIERAAVGGKVFYKGAVAQLSAEDARSQVGTHLLALVRRELIRRDQSIFAGEDAFRFRHMLIRDAAYESMSKQTRAELHERFAQWLETAAGERVTEFDEIVGHHLEQAYRYRLELGSTSQDVSQLAARAAEHLKQSGLRAQARFDHVAARSLLRRAVDLLPEDSPERLTLAMSLGRSLFSLGEIDAAREILHGARSRARALKIERVEAHSRILLLLIEIPETPAGKTEEARREVERLIPRFEDWADHLGLALAYTVLAEVNLMISHWGAMEEPLELALVHARKAGDRALEIEAISALAASFRFGPTPVDECLKRLADLNQPGNDGVQLSLLHQRCVLTAMLGQFDEAREMVKQSLAKAEDLGSRGRVAGMHGFGSGEVEMLAGDLQAAEREFRLSHELYEQMGEKGRRSTIVCFLAEALYGQGRDDEAEPLIQLSKELAAADDAASQMLWRAIRAKILARRGQFTEAEELGRQAIQVAEQTDQIDLHGQVLMSFAEVLEFAGKPHEATSSIEEAIKLFERKGNIVLAKRAQERLAQLSTTRTP